MHICIYVYVKVCVYIYIYIDIYTPIFGFYISLWERGASSESVIIQIGIAIAMAIIGNNIIKRVITSL